MPWSPAPDIAVRISGFREALGLNQAEFGRMAGVNAQQVSEWENDRAKPPRARLLRLCDQTGIPLRAFEGGGPMPATIVNRAVNERPDQGEREALSRIEEAIAALREAEGLLRLAAARGLGRCAGGLNQDST